MNVGDLAKAGFGLGTVFWVWLYYTGRVNWQGDKELRRSERVRKFGWLMIASMILGLICSLALIVLSFR